MTIVALTRRHDVQRPFRQYRVLLNPAFVELQLVRHCIPHTDEPVSEVVNGLTAHHAIATQDLARKDSEVIDEAVQSERSWIGGQRLGRLTVADPRDTKWPAKSD